MWVCENNLVKNQQHLTNTFLPFLSFFVNFINLGSELLILTFRLVFDPPPQYRAIPTDKRSCFDRFFVLLVPQLFLGVFYIAPFCRNWIALFFFFGFCHHRTSFSIIAYIRMEVRNFSNCE